MEVVVGAGRGEGGSRRRVVRVGGARAPPPFHLLGDNMPNPPAVAVDVFDLPRLPSPVKAYYGDVIQDPAEWAKRCVEECQPDLIALHLISTGPALGGRSPREAAKTVEDVLQAVDVPIIIGGSGNKESDPHVLAEAAEVADGERCILNSASLDMDYGRVADAALKHGHIVLSWTPLSVELQRRLNRELMLLNLPREQIIMDPTTAPLGYGMEYSVDVVERIRLRAFQGDELLQMPILSGSSNAWGAREARLPEPSWGPLELRGPLWEAVNALIMVAAGCDLLLMMHPQAVRLFRRMMERLRSTPERESALGDSLSWVYEELRGGGAP